MVYAGTHITQSAQETAALGEKLGALVGSRAVVCLYGELGAGKTIFSQGFARGVGVTTRLLSPTFIIVRRYEIPHKESMLYHIDLYRTADMTDLATLGLEEIFTDPQAIVLIEWAQYIKDMLPAGRIDVEFSEVLDDTRTITITQR